MPPDVPEATSDLVKQLQDNARGLGLGCTQTTTEIPFDDLILRMMRTAGALN